MLMTDLVKADLPKLHRAAVKLVHGPNTTELVSVYTDNTNSCLEQTIFFVRN